MCCNQKKHLRQRTATVAVGSVANPDEGGKIMLFEILKDFFLLVIGATIGLLICGLCQAAAETSRRIEKMKEENHEPGNFRGRH